MTEIRRHGGDKWLSILSTTKVSPKKLSVSLQIVELLLLNASMCVCTCYVVAISRAMLALACTSVKYVKGCKGNHLI